MRTLLIALALLQAPTDTLPDLSRPWSLQQCTDWALEHNLTVAQQEITLEFRPRPGREQHLRKREQRFYQLQPGEQYDTF